MKKIFRLLLMSIIFLCLVSCSSTGQPVGSSTVNSAPNVSTASSRLLLCKPGKNISMKEGTNQNGAIIFSSDEIAGVYTRLDKNEVEIVFQLTDTGKTSLAEKTKELAKSGGSASLWKGNEKLLTLPVYDALTGGAIAFGKNNANETKELYDKLQDGPKY